VSSHRLAQGGLIDRAQPLSFTFDGATFTLAGTPSIAFGPGHLARAHTVDEYVLVDDLVATAQALAVLALRFCGPAAS